MKGLCGDEACEEIVIPGGDLSAETQGIFAGGSSQQIMGHVLDGGEVGRTYLVRTHDRRGGQISLGPRSPETEAVFEQFWRDKQDAALRLRNAETRLAELARMNVALRLGRLPRLVAWLLT
ncbi:MAG: hypothetical protein H7Z12_03720, partial [Rhodospirillaceae bacterium]|nr:hypothetical protein [Rhodospirillales bacterium]